MICFNVDFDHMLISVESKETSNLEPREYYLVPIMLYEIDI